MNNTKERKFRVIEKRVESDTGGIWTCGICGREIHDPRGLAEHRFRGERKFCCGKRMGIRPMVGILAKYIEIKT